MNKLILMGWPGPLQPDAIPTNLVKVILREAPGPPHGAELSVALAGVWDGTSWAACRRAQKSAGGSHG
mgnify:CR=1 FL=1